MITRIWHGWTTPANAPVYENLLRSELNRNPDLTQALASFPTNGSHGCAPSGGIFSDSSSPAATCSR